MFSGISRKQTGLFVGGLALTSVSWFLAWSRMPTVSEHSFLPLWLGYILTVNGLGEVLFKDSLLRRMRFDFLWLFAASVPFWWFFEYLNGIVKNWDYVFPRPISRLEFSIRASIDFSTVIPAVLSTAFVFSCLMRRRSAVWKGRRIRIKTWHLVLSVLLGSSFFALLAVAPDLAFPLVWIAPILIIEPILYALKEASLLKRVEQGHWLLPISMMAAALFCGFWWELWNAYALPKWVYSIPHVGFWKVFEMPILGYLGYPFFGIIVYGYAALFYRLIGKKSAAETVWPAR